MPFHSRKKTRIPGFDYSSDNYYFVTICTHDKKCIFGSVDDHNQFWEIADKGIKRIEDHYSNVKIDHAVVMPNHVHMIIVIGCDQSIEKNPDLNVVIGQYKSGVSRDIRKINPNMVVWQRSYHDHIIRNQNSYQKIWEYIENNPKKWELDCFYCKN